MAAKSKKQDGLTQTDKLNYCVSSGESNVLHFSAFVCVCFACVYMYRKHVYVACTCRDQRLILTVFFSSSPPYILRQEFLVNPKVTVLASMLSLPPEHARIEGIQIHAEFTWV